MEHVFWLIPGRLAGRPGPDVAPWDLHALKRAGIDAVISVNDARLCHDDEFEAAGIAWSWVPFSDNAPPTPDDHETCRRALPVAYEHAASHVEAGRGVLVHCSAGKDRTGLLLGYFVMRTEELTPREAIARVRAVRPIAFSAEGWETFGERVLESLR